jgi:hypothetical protein
MSTVLLASAMAVGRDRNFKISAPGESPIIICEGDCINSKSLESSINSGTGKWMYDEAAKSLGFDSKKARRNPEQHEQVMRRYSAAIDGLIADQKRQSGKSANFHTAYRSNLAQVTREENTKAANSREVPVTESLNQRQAQKIAALPGASILADPAARGVVQRAVDIEMKLLSASPQLQKAAQAGLAVGVVGTVALAEYLAPDAPANSTTDAPPVADPADATELQKPENKLQLAPPVEKLDEKGERQKDNTCAPNGTIGEWVVVSRNNGLRNKEALADYQRQIAHTPKLPGDLMVEYAVTNINTGATVLFDGCATWDPRRQLLEATADNGSKYAAADASKSEAFRQGVSYDVKKQARRQHEIVGDVHPVEWHVAEEKVVPIVKKGVEEGAKDADNFSVIHTPKSK